MDEYNKKAKQEMEKELQRKEAADKMELNTKIEQKEAFAKQ
jgi:hypothetical protein